MQPKSPWTLIFVCVFSYSSPFPIKMLATDEKTQKIKPDPNFLWRTKVSEAVCKHDWHNMRLYFFFKCERFGREFRTQCAMTFSLDNSRCSVCLPRIHLGLHVLQWVQFYLQLFSLCCGLKNTNNNGPSQPVICQYMSVPNCLTSVSLILASSHAVLASCCLDCSWINQETMKI